jgi:crotonobetainyl-CoA:carnitine CoA-transferase CaiB-like acyl-CoA transferase
MADAATTLVSTSALLAAGGQLSPRRLGSESPLAAPSSVFVAGDGREIQIVCVTERHWRALCAAVDHTEWTDDPAFVDNAARLANRAMLHSRLAEVVATDAADAWVQRISAGGAICEHVRDIEEAWADERLVARGLVGELAADPPWANRMPVVSLTRSHAGPAGPLPPAPALGADTEAVMAELGLGAAGR